MSEQLCLGCRQNIADWLRGAAIDFEEDTYHTPEEFKLFCPVDGENAFVLGVPVPTGTGSDPARTSSQ